LREIFDPPAAAHPPPNRFPEGAGTRKTGPHPGPLPEGEGTGKASRPRRHISYLGIDVGTSQTKAAAFDESLHVLAQADAAYRRSYPRPGWCDLDPHELVKAVRTVVGRWAAACRKDPIAALSSSVLGGGICAIDARCQPLLPIISTADNRAQAGADDWARTFGRQRTYRITGVTTHSSLMLPKILWIRKHLPAAPQIHQFVTAAELAVSALGVPPQMDWATASTTMMLDITARTWSQEILQAAGIEPALLPPMCPSGTVIGEIPSPVCTELGLKPGCLLVAGGHDQQVCALGAGLIGPGKATDSLGTVECITTLFETPQLVDDLLQNNFSNLLHVYGDRIAMLAYNFSSGDLLRWYVETFCSGSASLGELLADLPEQPATVFVLPHFAGSGTPHLDARAKGAILGLSLATDRREILRGIIDGQNFEIRLNLEIWRRHGIVFDTLQAYGRGSTTDQLLQIKADMLQLAIEQLAVGETGCLGAALLAARGSDATYPLEDMLRRTVTCRRRFEPRPQHASLYAERFSLYRELYPAIRTIQQRMQPCGSTSKLPTIANRRPPWIGWMLTAGSASGRSGCCGRWRRSKTPAGY